MADALAAAAQARPDAPAVQGPDATWTYAQLDQGASDLAQRLAGLGLAPGQHVGVLLPPTALYVALVHAAARLGAVLVPLDPRLAAQELSQRASHAGLHLLLGDQVAPGLRLQGFPVKSVPELLRARPRPVVARTPLAEEPQALLFTSGTSGRARAAVLTHGNLKANAAMAARNLVAGPEDRWLALVPPWHVGGLAAVMRAARDGLALHLLPRFDAAAVNEVLDREPVTLASVVPVMLDRLLEARGDRPFPPRLRAVLVGGDAARPALLARARAAGLPLLPTYGLTEAASQVATAAPGDAALPPGSSGRPLPGLEVRLVDEAGRPVAAGEVGEIVVRGPTVARGYHVDPEATAATFREDGLHTGDLGRLDAQGYLFVLGRLGDRIVTGGEKVDPAQVEEALRAHPTVADACAVGVPDERWGEVVAAAVVLRPGAAFDAAALEAHARERLAKHQVPRRLVEVPELPRNATGKVARRGVRALLQASTEGPGKAP